MKGFLGFQNWYKQSKARVYTYLIRGDFGGIGKRSLIMPPFHSNDVSAVYVGSDCYVGAGSWIDCICSYGDVRYSPRIEIGDGTYMGHRAHIIACSDMKIGKNVVLADGVYISDNLHGFRDVSRPVMPQSLENPGLVCIEDEVWLGEGVCVLPNVTIGKHSVIGSNSVVTKSIPPYSIAVGIPANVIKKYDFDKKQWVKV
jgi:acetyltransferase-like isoleucine patch superfamily enzyme